MLHYWHDPAERDFVVSILRLHDLPDKDPLLLYYLISMPFLFADL